MDEMKMYQEGQATDEERQSQTAAMPDLLAQMRQIFADRDAEYTRMEQAYQKRKESLDEKEASLKETLSGLEGRLLAITKREEAVQGKETKLQEQIQNLAIEKAALQEAQEALEKEKTEQWMQVSLLREEARNEKLRSQRLAREYEEKLSRLPADSPYLSDLQETAKKQAEEKITALKASLRQKEQMITEMQAEEESREVQIAALQGTVESQKEELEKSKEENQQLKAENAYLTRAKQELEELSQTLPEQQKKDMDSLHALAKKLAEEKEVLEKTKEQLKKEKAQLEEENQRLQEEKGELFKKLMAGTQDRESWQENGGREEETDRVVFQNTEEIKADDISTSQKEPEPADVLFGEEPLTAETLQEYLQENGMDARLLHSQDGELVAVTAGSLQIMFSFREPPRFDIRKKQKGGWSMKKLLKRYNENKAGLVFTYDEREEEFIGSGEFSTSMSPEDLVHRVYQAARTYFGYRDEGER